MKVRDLMSSPARTCLAQDSLETAARLLWEHDCGILPVVDAKGRVAATITDRDICMGAYTRGSRLADLRVADSMSRRLVTCREDEDVEVAARTMVDNRIRRLPVVDASGSVRGVLSLNDLARRANADPALQRSAIKVLAAVSQPSPNRPAVAAPAPGATVPAVKDPNAPSPRAASMLAAKEMEC
jgi:CBS domain-containing protein